MTLRFINFVLMMFFCLSIPLLTSCGDEEEVAVEEEEVVEEGVEEEVTLTNGEEFLAEVNMARNALAAGEEAWNDYVEEVVEPVLVVFFGEDFSDNIIERFGEDYFEEVKNAYADGEMRGSSSYPSIPQSEFESIEPLASNEKLRSGAEKWTKYFLDNDVNNLHADFSGEIDISDRDEKGHGECVAPEFIKYKSARNIVVAFLVDPGVPSRGHRMILLNKQYESGGGYFDEERGGGTFRFSL